MNRPECAVKSCKREAFVAYGGKWICGECLLKIINKQKEMQGEEIENLE